MDRSDDRSLKALPRDAAAPADPAGAVALALFWFGLSSAAFDLGCVLIKTPFLRPGVTAGDAIEAAGIYVVLALFLWVLRLAGGRGLFAATAAVTFALGHGVHLAGNSLHDLADRSGAGDPTGLFHFWDETAGHYLVDSARVLFAAALLGSGGAAGAGVRDGAARGAGRGVLVLLGGAAYGFITFASSVEGQTVPLMLPVYALLAGYGVATARRPRGDAAVRLFFLTAAWTALLFFAVWGIWHQGFPEFTRTGILRGAAPHSDV